MNVQELKNRILSTDARIIAIDGNCASGKSTLAAKLAEELDATLFHMDDYFLRPEQRTAERRAEIGGNVDRERFYEEVLLPLTKRESVTYRRFDCRTQTLLPAVIVEPKARILIEGSYALHPMLRPHYDLRILLRIDPAVQRERILLREGAERAETFFSLWLPLENTYFSSLDADAADLVIDTSLPLA